MIKSLIFDNKDIITSSDYKPAVKTDVFIEKLLSLIEYRQDYSWEKVVDLQQAERFCYG